jgi:hypothetical protein
MHRRPAIAAALALFLLAGGCKDKPKKTTFGVGGGAVVQYVIHQPNRDYPDDAVLIYDTPSRSKRKFKLPPGTRVKVLETVSGEKYDCDDDLYKIRDPQGRVGWVPASHCKEKNRKK